MTFDGIHSRSTTTTGIGSASQTVIIPTEQRIPVSRAAAHKKSSLENEITVVHNVSATMTKQNEIRANLVDPGSAEDAGIRRSASSLCGPNDAMDLGEDRWWILCVEFYVSW